jgi:hypothetical protein
VLPGVNDGAVANRDLLLRDDGSHDVGN